MGLDEIPIEGYEYDFRSYVYLIDNHSKWFSREAEGQVGVDKGLEMWHDVASPVLVHQNHYFTNVKQYRKETEQEKS